MDLFQTGKKADFLFSTLTYHNSSFSLKTRFCLRNQSLYDTLSTSIYFTFSARSLYHTSTGEVKSISLFEIFGQALNISSAKMFLVLQFYNTS